MHKSHRHHARVDKWQTSVFYFHSGIDAFEVCKLRISWVVSLDHVIVSILKIEECNSQEMWLKKRRTQGWNVIVDLWRRLMGPSSSLWQVGEQETGPAGEQLGAGREAAERLARVPLVGYHADMALTQPSSCAEFLYVWNKCNTNKLFPGCNPKTFFN